MLCFLHELFPLIESFWPIVTLSSITFPLCTFIEHKCVYTFERCNCHAKLCEYIKDSLTHTSVFVARSVVLNEISPNQLTADAVYCKLIETTQYDDSVEVILKTIFLAILETLKRLLADFINEGNELITH